MYYLRPGQLGTSATCSMFSTSAVCEAEKSCWRPQRDLNPCYRRESTRPSRLDKNLEGAGGAVRPLKLRRKNLSLHDCYMKKNGRSFCSKSCSRGGSGRGQSPILLLLSRAPQFAQTRNLDFLEIESCWIQYLFSGAVCAGLLLRVGMRFRLGISKQVRFQSMLLVI